MAQTATLSHPISITDGKGALRRCEAVREALPTLFTPRALVNANKMGGCDSPCAATIFTSSSRMTSLLHFHDESFTRRGVAGRPPLQHVPCPAVTQPR